MLYHIFSLEYDNDTIIFYFVEAQNKSEVMAKLLNNKEITETVISTSEAVDIKYTMTRVNYTFDETVNEPVPTKYSGEYSIGYGLNSVTDSNWNRDLLHKLTADDLINPYAGQYMLNYETKIELDEPIKPSISFNEAMSLINSTNVYTDYENDGCWTTHKVVVL